MASNGHAIDVANGDSSSRGEAVVAQEESAAKADVEQPAEANGDAVDASALAVEQPPPEFAVPKMSYFKTFKIFLRFGFLAVGGPVRAGSAANAAQGTPMRKLSAGPHV